MPHDSPGFAAQLADDLSPEDFIQVLALLRGDIEQLVAALEGAAGIGDAKAFRAAAHGLAGTAGAVGAQALEQASRRGMAPQDSDALSEPAGEIRALADATLQEIAGVLAATS